MKVFVLTETDSTDYKWRHNETFFNKDNAIARMRERYHEEVVEREALVVKSEFNEESASAEMVDGLYLAWNIKETIVQ